MITTLWDSQTSFPLQNSPYQNETNNPQPEPLVLSSSAAANPAAVNSVNPANPVCQVDLGTVQNVGEYVSLELEIKNPAGVAPAAGTQLTMYAACASSPSKQPPELVNAALTLVCNMPPNPGVTNVWVMQLFYMAARYLYVWFAYSGDTNNAVPVPLRLRVNTKTG